MFGRIYRYSVNIINNILYRCRPNNIISIKNINKIDISNNYINNKAKITNSQIYTNRNDNISIFYKGYLIRELSWRYDDGYHFNVYEDKSLNGKLKILRTPCHYSNNIVSLLTGGGGNNNYYHWLFDVLPRLHILSDLYTDEDLFLIPDDQLGFQNETLNLFNIHKDRRINSRNHQYVSGTAIIACSHPNSNMDDPPKWIMDFLRAKFLPNGHRAKNKSRRIFIDRGDSINGRNIVNKNELFGELTSCNFEIIELSSLSFEEQVGLFSSAKAVIGLHGAGLSNIVFCNEGTLVIEIFGHNYQHKMYESISRNLDLNYSKVVATSIDNDNPQISDIEINENSINQIRNLIRSELQ